MLHQANIFNPEFTQIYIVNNIKSVNINLAESDIKKTKLYEICDMLHTQLKLLFKIILFTQGVWALILLGLTIPHLQIIDDADEQEKRQGYTPSKFFKAVLII